MILHGIDWLIIVAFFIVSLAVGVSVTKKAGSSVKEFFASSRNMPWWLLGISMVATTFSSDTPNLVTDMVRSHGVAGNWLWWSFLLTGMVTVFVYAKLWRRSEVLTDVEFYELRYSGKMAAFLRGFRAIYLGVFFNIIIMATVSLAAIKIGGVILGLSPAQTILISSVITVIYTMLGGLRGVLITDFIQFIIAMFGAVVAAVVAVKLPQIGGLSKLLSHPNVSGKLSIIPNFSDTSLLLTVFIIPLTVQWWSVWYPGAEPGGGGYIAQRMLAAKNEKHAMGATFFFNFCHYALRPWPWIIVALASMVIFPDLLSLRKAFPHISTDIIKNDMAYPAMLTFIPTGLLGIVITSLIAAYMSTIATHLNWGASYIVNDFYMRFIKKQPSEKELVRVGRISTVVLMSVAAGVALLLQNALQAFHILLQIGAGTGLLFLLRWFWWRINAASEIAAMSISFLVAVYFEFLHHPVFGFPLLLDWKKLIIGVGITTIGWIVVTLFTRPTDPDRLIHFYQKVYPGGPGWKKIRQLAREKGIDVKEIPGEKWGMSINILGIFLGVILIFGLLFGIGFLIYRNWLPSIVSLVVFLISGIGLISIWKKFRFQ